jgi:hypothetical protein
MKVGDTVQFTSVAKQLLGKYADDRTHKITDINGDNVVLDNHMKTNLCWLTDADSMNDLFDRFFGGNK